MMAKHVFRCMETDCSKRFGLLVRRHACTECGWLFCRAHVTSRRGRQICGSCLRRQSAARPDPSSVAASSVTSTAASSPPSGAMHHRRPPFRQHPQQQQPRVAEQIPPHEQLRLSRRAAQSRWFLWDLLPLLVLGLGLSACTFRVLPELRAAVVCLLTMILSVWSAWPSFAREDESSVEQQQLQQQTRLGRNPPLVSPQNWQQLAVGGNNAAVRPGTATDVTPPEATAGAGQDDADVDDSEPAVMAEDPRQMLERLRAEECPADLPTGKQLAKPAELRTWVELRLAEVDSLARDDKLFLALGRMQGILRALAHLSSPGSNPSAPAAAQLWEREATGRRWAQLQRNVARSNAFLGELARNEGWQLVRESCAGKAHPTRTFFRKEPDRELFSFKVTGTVQGDLIRIIAVLYETDLYPQWLPFLKRSVELGRPSRFRKQFLLQLWFPWPFQNRDLLLDGFGVDMLEDEQAVINVRSIAANHHLYRENLPQSGFMRGEMPLGGFLVKLLGQDKVAVTLMFNLDMNLNMSPSMINFFSGKLIHVLLGRIQSASRNRMYDARIAANPAVYAYIGETLRLHWKKQSS